MNGDQRQFLASMLYIQTCNVLKGHYYCIVSCNCISGIKYGKIKLRFSKCFFVFFCGLMAYKNDTQNNVATNYFYQFYMLHPIRSIHGILRGTDILLLN